MFFLFIKKFFVFFVLVFVVSSCVIVDQNSGFQDVEGVSDVSGNGSYFVYDDFSDDVLKDFVLPVKTVTQVSKGVKTVFGLDGDDRIVRIDFRDGFLQLFYVEGILVEVFGDSVFGFGYVDDRLVNVSKKDGDVFFEYDSFGFLKKIYNDEIWYLEHSLSSGLLREISRGVSGKTSIDYYKDDKIKYITRGSVTSEAFYDDKDRIRTIGHGGAEVILGYWRDDKLIKVTGKVYDTGLEVSYGPDYPPFNAKIISAFDSSEFAGVDTGSLYSVLDFYLYCNYVRRLQVSFDGVSFAFFVNYFDKGFEDYFVANIVCDAYLKLIG